MGDTEPMDIRGIQLTIDADNDVKLDLWVGNQWRRVIRSYHAGYTSHFVSRLALEIGEETTDVTAEYERDDSEEPKLQDGKLYVENQRLERENAELKSRLAVIRNAVQRRFI
jgi:hypothetical protein